MTLNINSLLRSIIILVVLTAAMILLQMWFHIFSDVIFWKLLATMVILGGVISFVIAIKQDMAEEKKLKDDKYVS